MAKTLPAIRTPYLALRRALPFLIDFPKPSFSLYQRTYTSKALALPKRQGRCHFRSDIGTRTDGKCFRWGFGKNLSTSVRASQVNGAGSIDSPLMQSMENKIKEQLNAESVIVKDASGDGRHVCIDVVSSAFEGQSAVNRQRMVYKAIWEELQTIVHAVDQMTTRTPTEASAQN